MTLRRLLLAGAVVGLSAWTTAAAAQTPPSQATRPVVAADARTTLSPGLTDAETAVWNLSVEHTLPMPPGFSNPATVDTPVATPSTATPPAVTPPGSGAPAVAPQTPPRPRVSPLALANTDMAMSNGRLFVGNFNGFNAYDTTSGAPELVMSVVCPGGQGDLSIHGNLLFMSVEENRARLDCGTSAAEGEVNAERFRGVRIFDISDMAAPRQIAAVQTCRGSHTHTLVPHPTDANVLYIYNSATSSVRRTDELGICSTGDPAENPETALYSIDVIRVPLDAPQTAAIVNRPRIFADRETGAIAGLWRGGPSGVATQRTAQTNHCHDITVYPELGLAAGACSGNGILLDISDPENPSRLSEMFDPDMAYWHSATFTNDGSKVLFTDEWGGGTAPRCRAEDPTTWGANMIASVEDRRLRGRAFFKLPGIQGGTENCVAHNGSLIPVPGRDLMVQAWYQGGLSLVDFTDPERPVEIAYFDRGPINGERLVVGGFWSAYWMNGRIYASEIARGLDVLRLQPSDQLSAAEIALAESVMDQVINPQTQHRITWTDSPDLAQAYVDQLTRAGGGDAALLARAGTQITAWRAGSADRSASSSLSRDLATAADAATGPAAMRMRALSEVFGRAAE